MGERLGCGRGHGRLIPKNSVDIIRYHMGVSKK